MKEFKIHIAESDGEQIHMSIGLRDYFAGQAMQAFISSVPYDHYVKGETIAEKAYQIADAMLKERQ
jgi:hypothetical protein